jgi:hypothetical protein
LALHRYQCPARELRLSDLRLCAAKDILNQPSMYTGVGAKQVLDLNRMLVANLEALDGVVVLLGGLERIVILEKHLDQLAEVI